MMYRCLSELIYARERMKARAHASTCPNVRSGANNCALSGKIFLSKRALPDLGIHTGKLVDN